MADRDDKPSDEELEVSSELAATLPSDSSREGLDSVTSGGFEPAPVGLIEGESLFAHGSKIDQFIVLDKLGGGGMGVVVSAYDTQLDRRVAIKVLRPDVWGQASEEAGQLRLLREAQAMAKLSHPNVVMVHEVGTIGYQVYIAMEYVSGTTLTGWLDDGERSWRAVCELFAEAGRGLAAAHEVGLVHRDFKPDNVLVGKDGRVRVTDFGLVARAGPLEPSESLEDFVVALSGKAALQSPLTRSGALMGTPVYMAPEQYKQEPVTAAADQFSFCVALYEALYGERPFAGDNFADLAVSVAKNQVKPAPRDARVPLWLREVALRGLKVDPAERHPSMASIVSALGSDPAASRRRTLGFGAVAVALVLMAGVAALSLGRGGGSAAKPCRGAGDKLVGIWDDEVKDRVATAFTATGRPHAAHSYSRVELVLDDYAARLVAMRTEACEATRVQGEQSDELLDLRMACLDRRLNRMRALTEIFAVSPDAELIDKAVTAANGLPPIDDCADAEALTAAIPPPRDPRLRDTVAELRNRLDQAASLLSAGKYALALAIAVEVDAAARAIDYPPLHAEAGFCLGSAQRDSGDFDAAEATLSEAVQSAAQARDDELVANALRELFFVVGGKQTRYREALAMLPGAQAAVVRAGNSLELRARLHQVAGDVQRVAGHAVLSRQHLERALALFEDASDPVNADVARALDSLGLVLVSEGDFVGARDYHARALAMFEKIYGSEHPEVARALYHLGSSLHDHGRYEDARGYYERALAIDRKALGPEHPAVAYSLNALGDLHRSLGDNATARKHLEEALAIWSKSLGPEHGFLIFPLNNLGGLLEREGKFTEARLLHERALAIALKAHGPKHGDVGECYYNLGNNFYLSGDYEQGLAYHRLALALYERAGRDHPYVAWALTGMGECQVGAGQAAAAIAPLERALKIREVEKGDTAELGRTRFIFARALWASRSDRKRALLLARQAHADYQSAGSRSKRQLAAVEQWLTSRRSGGD